jgi:hypothetical protein
MKHQEYYTRALQARDPRYARIFDKLGYRTADLVAHEGAGPDIHELRKLYEELTGKRPFNGWDAPTLSAKIAEKRAGS